MSMYACGIFAILYPLNAFNMVFPFIWYPPSKLALLTQQVLRDRRRRAAHALRSQHQPLRTQLSFQSLLRRGDNSESIAEVKAIDVGAELDDKSRTQATLLLPTDDPATSPGIRHRSSNRQLILDSLVMSHSLPIQGFYCRPPLKFPTAVEDPETDELEIIQSSTFAGQPSPFSGQRQGNLINDGARHYPPPSRPPRSLMRSTSLTVIVHKHAHESSMSSTETRSAPSPWPATPASSHAPSASHT